MIGTGGTLVSLQANTDCQLQAAVLPSGPALAWCLSHHLTANLQVLAAITITHHLDWARIAGGSFLYLLIVLDLQLFAFIAYTKPPGGTQ